MENLAPLKVLRLPRLLDLLRILIATTPIPLAGLVPFACSDGVCCVDSLSAFIGDQCVGPSTVGGTKLDASPGWHCLQLSPVNGLSL